MSWKPEVEVNGQWAGNAVVFATQEEAAASAKDLYNRWALATNHRAVETSDPVNYRLVDGHLVAISGNT